MRPFLCISVTLIIRTCANAITMDETEVSIGKFSEFVASSSLITHAEQHGGMVYGAGWIV